MEITTRSGRVINSPNIRLNRFYTSDGKEANTWLLEEVKKEYVHPQSSIIKIDREWLERDYIITMLNAMNPDNINDLDGEILMDLLFSDEWKKKSHWNYIFELVDKKI